MTPGFVVILNGAPRSGKTSIARALQEQPGPMWLNLGVDAMMATFCPRAAAASCVEVIAQALEHVVVGQGCVAALAGQSAQ